MPATERGIDPRLQKGWSHAIEKQELLRLTWFRNNEKRLNEIANKPPSRVVPESIKREVKENLKKNFRDVEKHPKIKTSDPDPPFPLRTYQSVMKPVDPAVTKIFYTATNKDGRMRYLNQRVKLIPENRYYFPEVSSWMYGWKMWNLPKTMPKTGFGKQQIIKDSFYRRRGVGRDPEWYKEPTVFSPNICNCT